MGHSDTLSGLGERFGLTVITQVAIVSATILSLAAIAWPVSQALLHQSEYTGESSPTQQQTMPDLNLISQADLFGKISPAPVAESDDLPSTRLQWVLQGVFTGAEPTSGSAIILASDNSAKLYKAKQPMPGGATLTEVHPDHVVINLNGRLETLRFPNVSAGPSPQQNSPPLTEPTMNVAEDTASNRREIVRQRLEMLRQRALSRP
jgi:general secretion pathway protein C